MHSFRLRYVALGLLIYIQSAFSRTCGTDFDDAASSAVLADTVLLATATRQVRDGGGGTTENQLRAVRFRVERVYKGNIPEADVVDGGGRRKPMLVVAAFNATPDRQRCVAPLTVPGSRYVVFLRAGDGAERSSALRMRPGRRRRRRLRISAFPVPVSDKVIDVVELYANCNNRCRKYMN